MLIVLLIVAGANLAGPAGRVAAYSVTFSTLQHNVRFTHINSIKFLATNNADLWVITAQELCRNEYDTLN